MGNKINRFDGTTILGFNSPLVRSVIVPKVHCSELEMMVISNPNPNPNNGAMTFENDPSE